jgi:hypothetical protein
MDRTEIAAPSASWSRVFSHDCEKSWNQPKNGKNSCRPAGKILDADQADLSLDNAILKEVNRGNF